MMHKGPDTHTQTHTDAHTDAYTHYGRVRKGNGSRDVHTYINDQNRLNNNNDSYNAINVVHIR